MTTLTIDTFELELAVSPDIVQQFPAGNNLELGIKQYGLGLEFDADLEVGVVESAGAELEVGILPTTVNPPTDVLAVHVGQGSVLFQWTEPSNAVKRYEVYASIAENSGYEEVYQFSPGRGGILPNVPLGINAYFRVRSVHPDGAESSFAQAKLGQLATPNFNMDITGISGSTIANGAIFTALHPETQTLIGFKALADIEIQ